MKQSLLDLASSYPARISCVNFSWQDVCHQISGLGLVRLVGGREVILSPLGHFFTSLSLPFHLSMFLLVAMMLQTDDQMWHCVVCRAVSFPSRMTRSMQSASPLRLNCRQAPRHELCRQPIIVCC